MSRPEQQSEAAKPGQTLLLGAKRVAAVVGAARKEVVGDEIVTGAEVKPVVVVEAVGADVEV